MRVIIHCSNELADRTHRQTVEFIDADPGDTGEDVRFKITMVFMDLDPESFRVYTNTGRLFNNRDTLRSIGPVDYLEIKEGKASCCQLI